MLCFYRYNFMRSRIFLAGCLLIFLSTLGGVSAVRAAISMDHTRGYILLHVNSLGAAWYVLPTKTERFYIKNGDAAYSALRNFGLGITDADLWQIPIGIQQPAGVMDNDQDGLADKLEEALGTNNTNTDSDNDGYSDLDELNNSYNPLNSTKLTINTELVDRLKGYILLQVESRGEAWYVNPADGKRYYMADGDWAYEIMRLKSLGINDDIAQIPLYDGVLQCDQSIDCMIGSIEVFTDFEGVVVSDISLFGQQVQVWSKLEYSATSVASRYPWTWTTLRQTVNGVEQENVVGTGQHCRSNHYTDLIDVLSEVKLGNYSTETPSTMLCESFGTE